MSSETDRALFLEFALALSHLVDVAIEWLHRDELLQADPSRSAQARAELAELEVSRQVVTRTMIEAQVRGQDIRVDRGRLREVRSRLRTLEDRSATMGPEPGMSQVLQWAADLMMLQRETVSRDTLAMFGGGSQPWP